MLIDGSPIAAAAIAWHAAAVVPPKEGVARAGVVLGRDGRLTADPAIRLERVSADVAGGSCPATRSRSTEDGAPVLEAGGGSDLELG